MKSINFLFENLGTERIVRSMSAEPTWEEREKECMSMNVPENTGD